jgi:hypothetical protein
VPNPFAYPNTAHVRKHGPHGYADYQDYRPWLRDEFIFRCVFCLYREQWPSTQIFQIDHLLPRSRHPERELDYDNLLYLCPRCNGNKRAQLVPDPCRVALANCLRVHPDGTITAQNRTGLLLVKALRLDNAAYTQMRSLMIQIVNSCARGDRGLFASLMGFPRDLPDLSNLNCPGNKRPDGVRDCFHALRGRGELPEVY